eukprot:2128337-Pleurochrysis_carterae.AAC.1
MGMSPASESMVMMSITDAPSSLCESQLYDAAANFIALTREISAWMTRSRILSTFDVSSSQN